MTRRYLLVVVSLTTVLGFAGHVDARNLFNRLNQAQPEAELLPGPSYPTQPRLLAPAPPTPYLSVQKTPYEAMQKGGYPLGHVATRVNYVQHRPHKATCCNGGPSYQTMLTVTDPCTGCALDVPVCLPACCAGAPQASGRKGLFGRGITHFTWCCGYSVRVVTDRHGAVTVHYYGV